MNTDIIDTLTTYFKNEILNQVERCDEKLIIRLADGTIAKINIVNLT